MALRRRLTAVCCSVFRCRSANLFNMASDRVAIAAAMFRAKPVDPAYRALCRANRIKMAVAAANSVRGGGQFTRRPSWVYRGAHLPPPTSARRCAAWLLTPLSRPGLFTCAGHPA